MLPDGLGCGPLGLRDVQDSSWISVLCRSDPGGLERGQRTRIFEKFPTEDDMEASRTQTLGARELELDQTFSSATC